MGRPGTAAALVLQAALVVLPRSAAALCEGPQCCFEPNYADKGYMVAQAEVTAAGADSLSLSLLPTRVYCDGGVECSPAGFPTEFAWGEGSPCTEEIRHLAPLAVGERAVVLAWAATGCLRSTFRVVDGMVECDTYQVPVEFELEHSLEARCIQATIDAGYFAWCDDAEGCAHAGRAGGAGLALAVALGLLRRRRRR